MRDADSPCVSHFPTSHEKIEGKIVDSSSKEHRSVLEQQRH
jgi:hypothetical protein